MEAIRAAVSRWSEQLNVPLPDLIFSEELPQSVGVSGHVVVGVYAQGRIVLYVGGWTCPIAAHEFAHYLADRVTGSNCHDAAFVSAHQLVYEIDRES